MVHRSLLSLVVLLCISGSPVLAQTFVHPGLYNSAAELTHMAAAVNANVQPQRRHYDILPNTSAYAPRSNATLVIETWTDNPAAEYNDLQQDCYYAYAAALQWVVENHAGNTTVANQRAAKAIQILNHLASNVNNATGHDLQLRLAIFPMPCHGASEIMRYVYGSWPGAQAYADWTGSFLYPRLPPLSLRNWATSGGAARVAIGVVRNNQSQYNTGLNDLMLIIRDDIIAPGRHSQTCRSGNSPDFSLVGGDLPHVSSVFWTYARVAEIIKHQGGNLYAYVDPTDGLGLEATLLYHDQWFGFPTRAGSTDAGWPCDLPLNTIPTYATGAWNAFANHYGDASFYAVADWCNAVLSTSRCLSNTFFPHEGLTHRYNDGTPPVGDTTDPSVPGSPAAVANSASQITVSWTASTDNVGVTQYRIDHCQSTTPATTCTPTAQLVLVPATQLSYAHAGLAANTRHFYAVRARDAAGNESTVTAPVNATTSAATPSPIVGPAIFLSTTGNDLNNGQTEATPVRNIYRALTLTGPGQTLYVRGGTYLGQNAATGTDGAMRPRNGTSWASPVTIRNYPGETVIFTRDYARTGCFFNVNSNTAYIQWIGDPVTTDAKRLVFGGPNINDGCSINSPSGAVGQIRLHNVEIRNNGGTSATRCRFDCEYINMWVHHNGDGRLDHGMYDHPDRLLVRGGRWSHNSGFALQLQNTDEQNGDCNTNCGTNAITIDSVVIDHNLNGGLIIRGGTGPGGSQVINNLFYANEGSSAVLISNFNSLMAHNTVYGNNVITQAGVAGANCQVRLYRNPSIINNLVWGSATNRADFCLENAVIRPPGPATFRNNLFGTGTYPTTANPITINPMVVNAANNDFRLLAGSPAINTGLTLAGVPRDYAGATRPVGASSDIGAYEFGGAVTPPAGDSTPPSPPTNLQLTFVAPTQVTLNWTDSTDNVAVTGYRVYRCSHTGGGCVPTQVIASPTVSTYVDTTVAGATMYLYAVAAVDAVPNLSQLSSTAAITTSPPVADITDPTIPTGLVATPLNASQIALTWTASTDAVGVTGYLIRRCTGVGCTPAAPDIDTTATTSYTSQGLVAETTYGFAVAARDAAGNISDYSAAPYAYATTQVASGVPSIVLLLNNNTNNTGTSGAIPVNTGVTFTTVTGQEGAASGLWNASTDVITVPISSTGGFAGLPLIDDCNRTEDPLSSGGQWTTDVLSTDPSRMTANGTACVRAVTVGNASSWWDIATFGPDMGVSALLPDATVLSGYPMLFVRLQQPGVAGQTDGYQCRFFVFSEQVHIDRLDNSVATPVCSNTTLSAPISDGHSIACTAIGNTIAAFVQRGSTWTQECSVVDNTYATAGYAGIGATANTVTFDNIRAGTVATGFTSPTNLTIALSFYPQTDFSINRALFGHSSTTSGFANRIQLRTTDTARVSVGLGDNSMVTTDVTGAPLSLNTLYRVWLRIGPTGYRVAVAQAGTGFIGQTSGAHSGLTTLGPNFAVGNNLVNNTQGFLGALDAVELVQREWSDAEVIADCVARGFSCAAPPPPTFDPFVMATAIQGDAVASANNRNLAVSLTGTPDPAVCADLTQFFLAYAGVRDPITGCSLQGSSLQLNATGTPASANVVLTLTYVPTSQQIFVTNSTVADPTTGNNLQQASWWCRRDGAETTPWEQLPNQACRVPSPGVINLRVDLLNTGGSPSLAQAYVLYCDTDTLDEIDGVRIAEVSTTTPFPCTAELGVCLNRVSRGVADGTVREPVLPNPSGVTAIAAGTLQRTDVPPIAPVLAPNERTEFEFSLKIAPGVETGSTFHCGLRPASSGTPLSFVNLAPIRVDRPRFFSE